MISLTITAFKQSQLDRLVFVASALPLLQSALQRILFTWWPQGATVHQHLSMTAVKKNTANASASVISAVPSVSTSITALQQ